MEPKSGVKTSELYVAVLVTLFGVLMSYGVVNSEEADAWILLGKALIALFTTLAPAITYMITRYKLKK